MHAATFVVLVVALTLVSCQYERMGEGMLSPRQVTVFADTIDVRR